MIPPVIVLIVSAAFSQITLAADDLKAELDSLRHYVMEKQDRLEMENDNLRAIIEAMNTTSVGTTYVRWDRTECPTSAELIYSGKYRML